MNRLLARNLMLGLTAAAALGAAGGYVTFAGGEEKAAVVAAPTLATARALGARWRVERTDALAAAYANALLSVGQYDRLLTELSEYGLFAGDGDAIALYYAEATLRQGRFDAALDAARGGKGSAGVHDPYLALARARAHYAMTGDSLAVEQDLSLALRGPQFLATQAYLFRSRLALDANDLASALAAARRARELGADGRVADDVAIEAAIRSGDLKTAASALDERSKAARRAFARDGAMAPPSDDRLAAMLKLWRGDIQGAVRIVDQAPPGADDMRTSLLSALAKFMNGDSAQAYALTTAWLAASPDDWMGLDLAAAIARDLGRNADVEAHLARLEKTRADLAAFRRYTINGNADAAFDVLSASTTKGGGVAAALAGAGFDGVARLAEPSADFQTAARLAVALSEGDELELRSLARAGASAELPITLALAGEAYEKIGETERAADLFIRASQADPAFAAPVRRRAMLLRQKGGTADALALWGDFFARNPDNHRARLALAMLQVDLGAVADAVRSFSALPPQAVFTDRDAALSYARSAVIEGEAASATMIAAAEVAAGPLLLGEVLEAAGKDAQAASQYRKALIADPVSDTAPRLYLASMQRLGRGDEAASLLREVTRRRPEANAAAAALKMAENNSLTAGL